MSGMDAASSIPPLQAFSRLSADAFSRTSPTAQAALRRLGTYLETQSCNLAELEVVRQWDRQRSTDGTTNSLQEVGVDVAALEHLVASRASNVRTAVEQSRERAAILMGAASPTNTNGRPGAAPDGSRGSTTSVVEWWQLGRDNPWSFTLTTQETSPASCASCEYRLACLRDSIDLVEPFLLGMRCAAALGAEDVVASTHTEGVSYVMGVGAGGEATSMFASLELARTYVTLSFRDRGGLAAVEKAMLSCHALEDLRRVADLLERLDIKESNAQDTPQPQMATDPAAGTLTRVQAYWSLAAAYAVFFHTVAAYLSGASGNFEGFATAVLGTADAPPDLPLWGAASFPFLSFVATESNAGTAHRAETSSGTSRQPAQVHTRLAALFPSSSSHVTGGAADFFLADYRPLVTTVIAPATTFGTLLVLSAVATLPLPVVTQRLPLWVELHTLYEESDELVALLLALRDGRLGAAWRLAKDAAAANLAYEPHVSQSVLRGLLFAVQRALCFHYLSARGAADVARAAQDLCFDSAEEFAAVSTSLVCDGYIDARIDAVAGSIELHTAAPAATTSDGGEMSEAVGRAVLGLSALEMQLTCLSAERNLIFVPANPDD